MTAEQMDAAVAQLVEFMGSTRFGLEADAIPEPISEKDWRSRGRWWPDHANITCLVPMLTALNQGE